MDSTAVIALMRGLYPVLTTSVAPDAFLLAWYNHMVFVAGEIFVTRRPWAVAHLLAHISIIENPEGLLPPGYGLIGISSISTGDLSVSYTDPGSAASSIFTDAWLARTTGGACFIQLRDSTAAIVVPRVY